MYLNRFCACFSRASANSRAPTSDCQVSKPMVDTTNRQIIKIWPPRVDGLTRRWQAEPDHTPSGPIRFPLLTSQPRAKSGQTGWSPSILHRTGVRPRRAATHINGTGSLHAITNYKAYIGIESTITGITPVSENYNDSGKFDVIIKLYII